MLSARLLRPSHGARHNRLYQASEAVFGAALNAYATTLRHVLAWRRTTLFLTILSLAASLYLFAVVPKGFFPIEDTGQIFAITEAAQDTSFDAMAARQKAVAAIIQANPNVTSVNSSVGAGGSSPSLNQGRVFLSLKPRDERSDDIMAVIQQLRHAVAAVPGMKVFFQPVQNISVGGRLSKSQYQYTLQSGDLDELYHYAPLMRERIAKLPGFQDVTSDLQIGNRQAIIEIDADKAARYGLTADDIRNTLFSSFGTRQISTIYTPSNDYQVIIETDPRFQRDPSALSHLYVRPPTPGATPVPLDAVATVKQGVGALTIDHQAQLPSVTISFNLAPGVSLGEAVDRISEAEHEMNLPVTVSTGFQGTAQVFQDSLRGQGLLLTAAVLVIYIVLGILYESFIHPVTILSGLPAAGLGALLTLLLFGEDLSVIAIIGIVMLIGIVKKNAIMMVDFAIERRKTPGTSAESAIYEACLLRFRPIMMTTMAAIMGTLPIAIGLGTGSELRRPLGLVVVGGLLVSQLLTLYITPVVYTYMEKLDGLFRSKESAEAAAEPIHEGVPAGE
jgi:HAE1 family hydrophobic/amphiphilic exporter-1